MSKQRTIEQQAVMNYPSQAAVAVMDGVSEGRRRLPSG